MAEIDLNDLADRVEKLEGPCRETDILIASATGYEQAGTQNPVSYYLSELGIEWLMDQAERQQSIFHHLPHYTASIDAAMTLIPESYMLNRLSDILADGLNLCELVSPGKPDAVSFGTASHATAICCASLSARLMEGEGEK